LFVDDYKVLETVKAAQLQNGLRHRDFQRYRQYCTRRLRRIRKSMKFMHGKGKLYINKKVDAETATEARYCSKERSYFDYHIQYVYDCIYIYIYKSVDFYIFRCIMQNVHGVMQCN
jgi:hypothetical protein